MRDVLILLRTIFVAGLSQPGSNHRERPRLKIKLVLGNAINSDFSTTNGVGYNDLRDHDFSRHGVQISVMMMPVLGIRRRNKKLRQLPQCLQLRGNVVELMVRKRLQRKEGFWIVVILHTDSQAVSLGDVLQQRWIGNGLKNVRV